MWLLFKEEFEDKYFWFGKERQTSPKYERGIICQNRKFLLPIKTFRYD
jgi:hypothetical protein